MVSINIRINRLFKRQLNAQLPMELAPVWVAPKFAASIIPGPAAGDDAKAIFPAESGGYIDR